MPKFVSEAVFTVVYEGDAVRDGEMEVSDLAPALMGLAQILKSAGKVVEGDESDIGVRVRSTRTGSFEVDLTVVIHGAKTAWAFWKSDDVQAASSLLGFLGVSVGGLGIGALQIIKKLRGRRPAAVTPVADGRVAIEVDGEVFEAPDMALRLALDPGVRIGMEKAIAEPLEREGIESVSFGRDRASAKIEKVEAEAFKMPAVSGADEFVSKHVKPFSIVSLSFKTGQKWRLDDGRAKPLVKMSDVDFQARVDSGTESFAKGDILLCEVVETTRKTPAGFKSDYEIVRVIEHQKVVPPPSLDFEG